MRDERIEPATGSRATGIGILTLAVPAAVMFFAGLHATPLWDEDETRFASVAREMVTTGDWVVPRFNGQIADKPPLLFWMIASAFSLFGESAGAARASSAILSIVTLVAVWWMATRLYDRACAWWSALVLSTSLLFMAEARLATTDASLLAFVSLGLAVAVGGWWDGAGRLSLTDHGVRPLSALRALAVGAIGGLGILCKGPAALMLPLVTLWIFAWWIRSSVSSFRGLRNYILHGWHALGCLRPVFILTGAMVVAAPWHLAVWQQTGGEWFQLFYGKHYLGRLVWLQPLTGEAMAPPAGHGGFPFFQVVALLAGLFPWSVFLPLAAWRTFRGATGKRETAGMNHADLFLMLWLLVWLFAVSLSSTQLPHYAFPAYPAACMMIAALVVGSFRAPAGLRRGWLYAACAGLVVGGLIISVGSYSAATILSLPVLAGAAWLGVIPAACAILIVLAVKMGARKVAAGIFAAGAIILSWAVFHVTAPAIGESNAPALLVAKAREVSNTEPRIACFRYTSPGLVWAARNRVLVCQSADEIAAFLLSGPDAFAVVNADACDEISSAVGYAVRPLMRFRPLSRRLEVVLLGPAPKAVLREFSPSKHGPIAALGTAGVATPATSVPRAGLRPGA